MRRKFAKAIFALFMLAGGNLQAFISDNDSNENLLRLIGGDLFQLISLHVGATSETYQIPMGDTKSKSGASVGVSAGVNYLLAIPVGARLRFMYSDMGGVAAHKSLGVVTYIHLGDMVPWLLYYDTPVSDIVAPMLTPSLVLGGGAIFSSNGDRSIKANGSYFEFGLAFFKTIPLNVEFLYRMKNYDANNPIGFGKRIDSFEFIFTIF
ncbi:hypothetical protein BKN38_07910 [Helicobacter sp. CLO-3]|uniref:hypothetical protein n=1 Tax=unclassified Helicobacter TaxID=2593540 RepID=UPI0008048FDB|nr:MULTISPECIES: hypothetical protein [unclassified Helicobacter]OBV29082.1 hypothetical protein BA723_06990 [Helicobacter sp. CLO-3]OHU81958.1 hypothetical protein BKN38_07910 [Helicobacter sp. CLO-3]